MRRTILLRCLTDRRSGPRCNQGVSAPIFNNTAHILATEYRYNPRTLADEAGVFSFAQFSVSPFVQRAENKKFLKNGNKIGVLVGYHLEAATQARTKILPRNFQKAVDFPSSKFRISERTF